MTAATTAQAEGWLQPVERSDHPFPYFLSDKCLPQALEAALLNWFETEAPWRLVETDFYEQYEFSLLGVPLPSRLEAIASPSFLQAYVRAVEEASAALAERRCGCYIA